MRITKDEAIMLYQIEDLNELSRMALEVREHYNQQRVWYNRNFHLEPSNICIHRCTFCSYRRESSQDEGAWSMSLDEIREYCREKFIPGMSELHIVGSVHPERGVDYYYKMIEIAREELPSSVTIKAFSAVEIDDMARMGSIEVEELLKELIKRGVSALPGGGAEIFSPTIREKIAPDKCSGERWLEIHKIAHKLGMRTNATMLFGHIEGREDRIDHLLQLRTLQDETGGFDAFIPLLFKAKNNPLSYLGELDIVEILKTFAISRLLLDNIAHIKSYWPMLGKELSQLTLLYGADDMDGTINDSTKIYSMAGSSEMSPSASGEEIEKMASQCGFTAVERDSFYNEVIKKM